jgi:hypothetical protein
LKVLGIYTSQCTNCVRKFRTQAGEHSGKH